MTGRRSEREREVSLKVRIAAYNIIGISGKSKHIMDFYNALDIDVIGLTETWQLPEDCFVLPLQYEAGTVPPVKQQWRGHKGVALALGHAVNYKRKDTSITTNTMYATVRIKDLYLTVLYAAPQTPCKELTHTLNRIRRSSRGPSIIMGDLNARDKNWDTNFNTAGTTLLR